MGMATFHPREPRSYGRREFLERSMLGVLGLTVAGPLLAACSNKNSAFTPPALQLARPDNPVLQPLYASNPAVKSGLEAESGPLRIYNWNGYLWPRIMKDF